MFLGTEVVVRMHNGNLRHGKISDSCIHDGKYMIELSSENRYWEHSHLRGKYTRSAIKESVPRDRLSVLSKFIT